MGKNPKAEFLSEAARLEELIEKSITIIEKSNALLNQIRRLFSSRTERQQKTRQTGLDSSSRTSNSVGFLSSGHVLLQAIDSAQQTV